jgi:phospholipid N-methyltransferase
MSSHAVSRSPVQSSTVNGSVNGAARGGARDAMVFALNFFKHPWMIGSFIPSSPFLVRRVLAHVDWPAAETIIEYGPGVGTFTREILRNLPSHGTLIVFETNRDFCHFLERTIHDSRLRVVHGSAEKAREVLRQMNRAADYAISGIPFRHFPRRLRTSIVEMTHDVLRPGGRFLVYQFSRAVLPILESTFGSVRREFEPLNIMPAKIYSCLRSN